MPSPKHVGAPGKKHNIWLWASMPAKPKQETDATDTATVKSAAPAGDDDAAVRQLLIDNGNVTAPVFYNLLKANGFAISRAAPIPKADGKPAAECTSGSEFGAQLRADGKKREAGRVTAAGCHRMRFLESKQTDTGVGYSRFKVCLLREGLGNFKDRFFYTREALASAIPLFEGRKFFVDHPDAIEEQTRPERSVRDIAGYFESLAVEDDADGTAMLVGDLCVMQDEPYRWVRALMREAVQYQQTHPDKDLVGLSINASGTSEPADLVEFMAKGELSESTKAKLKEALDKGVEELKIVSAFGEAVSCDLVTEAGAGGKIIQMLEKEKSMSDDKKKETDGKAAPGAAGHDDADQDKALIAQMIKKHLGDGDHSEEDEAAAHKAFEYFKKEGKMETEEAAKHAAETVKCSKHLMAKQAEGDAEPDADDKGDGKEPPKDGKKPPVPPKKEGKKDESEESEESEESDESEKKLEAMRKKVVALEGQVAGFKEADRKREIESHLDKKLAASGLPMHATKRFKESVKTPKSKEEVDALLTVFTDLYREARGEAHLGIGFALTTEKVDGKADTRPAGLGGCLRK